MRRAVRARAVATVVCAAWVAASTVLLVGCGESFSSLPDGGGGSTATTPPCSPGDSNSFQDAFSDDAIDPAWNRFGNAEFEETGGALRITPALADATAGAYLPGPYDLRGCQVSVRFALPPPGGTGARMALGFGPEPTYSALFIATDGLEVSGLAVAAGSVVYSESAPLAPASLYVRIREQGGMVFFERSADGSGWSSLFGAADGDLSTPGYVTSGQIELSAQGASVDPTSVPMAFDDFNLP